MSQKDGRRTRRSVSGERASHTPRLAAASSEFRKILDQTPTKLARTRMCVSLAGSMVLLLSNISAGLNKLAKQISPRSSGRAA